MYMCVWVWGDVTNFIHGMGWYTSLLLCILERHVVLDRKWGIASFLDFRRETNAMAVRERKRNKCYGSKGKEEKQMIWQ